MARIAMRRNILAARVIVIDPQSGRKLAAGGNAAPVAQFVIINEEDADVDIESTCRSLLLHAQVGDHVGCSRLLKMLNTLDIEDESETAESILCDVIMEHDAGWRTSVKTLMHVGVSGAPAFQEAVRIGFFDGVVLILSIEPALVDLECEEDEYDSGSCYSWDADAEYTSSGNTALIIAASHGVPDEVDQLLAAGANVDHANSDGDTALTKAASTGRADVVVKLLAAGANFSHANLRGDTAFTLAAYNGDTYMVDALLAAGSGEQSRNG